MDFRDVARTPLQGGLGLSRVLRYYDSIRKQVEADRGIKHKFQRGEYWIIYTVDEDMNTERLPRRGYGFLLRQSCPQNDNGKADG
jgi:hypothetical protein